MARIPIVVPAGAFPKKDPEHPCPCQFKEVHLEFKMCLLVWTAEIGACVEAGQVICEGEVDKKSLEFMSPATGILAEKCYEDDDEFTAGDILGYIETEA